MSKKYNHIEHLTPELIKAYQEGTLSADEMYAVEKFLLENPFEAEALEGLEMVVPASLDGHMEDLNARLSDMLTEDDETQVVFWTMTRRIAATLLILITAGFFLFWPDPEIPTRELTRADNKTEQPGKDSAGETLGLQKDDTDEREPLTAERKVSSEEKQEDIKTENDEVENQASGWLDSDKLQANVESAPDLSLDQVKAKVQDEGLIANKTLSLAGLKAGDDIFKSEDPVTTAFDTKVATSLQPVTPVKVETASLATRDSLTEKERARADEKLFQDKTQPIRAESERALRTDFMARNKLARDTTQGVQSNSKFIMGQSKLKSSAFSVSGVVVDDQGNPLPGVQVQIKGTSIGIHTDIKGVYSLSSTVAISSLLFRYLGYATQEREVKGKKEINVEMIPDVSSLGEVVVSDYSPPQPADEEEVVRNYNPARPVYGQKAFTKHVKENLIYPKEAAAQKIRGRVLVEFTVTAEGNLKDIQVLKGLGYGCDEEAIRLVKTGPKWQARRAGIDRSTPVDSKVRVRIRFKP